MSNQFLSAIDDLLRIKEIVNGLPDFRSRRFFPTLAIVLKNNDPEQRRFIKIADPIFEGKIESNWIRPIRVTQNSDPPLPEIGQSVIVFYINGDPELGYYLPVILDSNPSRVKKDSVKDESQEIPGNRDITVNEKDSLTVKANQELTIDGDQQLTIGGDRTESVANDYNLGVTKNTEIRSEQSLRIEAGQSITLMTDSGAFISLSASGIATIQDAFGRSITLGGSGLAGKWNLNNLPLRIENATSFTINNKEILTVGSVDNEGQTNVTKGW